jgi:hypothetical protein
MSMNLIGVERFAFIGLGAVGLAWALIHSLLPRRKTVEELERARRLDLHHRGRLAFGQIVDLAESENAQKPCRLVVYQYEVAGVSYEVAQDVALLPEIYEQAKRMAGRAISLKYDPKRPSNSIIACEQWSGIYSSDTPRGPQPKACAESRDR